MLLSDENEQCFICEDFWFNSSKDIIRKSVCKKLPVVHKRNGNLYCVLHFPDDKKHEKTDYFYILSERINNEEMDFSYVYFPENFSLYGQTFKIPVKFWFATFSAQVNFEKVTFEKEADFRFATFKQDAYFNSANFLDKAIFPSTIFKKRASFHSTEFLGNVDFDSAIFKADANFSTAKFKKHGKFRNSSLKVKVILVLPIFAVV